MNDINQLLVFIRFSDLFPTLVYIISFVLIIIYACNLCIYNMFIHVIRFLFIYACLSQHHITSYQCLIGQLIAIVSWYSFRVRRLQMYAINIFPSQKRQTIFYSMKFSISFPSIKVPLVLKFTKVVCRVGIQSNCNMVNIKCKQYPLILILILL